MSIPVPVPINSTPTLDQSKGKAEVTTLWMDGWRESEKGWTRVEKGLGALDMHCNRVGKGLGKGWDWAGPLDEKKLNLRELHSCFGTKMEVTHRNLE